MCLLTGKNPQFYRVGGTRSKKNIFRFLGYPSTILRSAHSLQETVFHKPMVPVESRDAESERFASLRPGIWQI